jgi:hypothetical protein
VERAAMIEYVAYSLFDRSGSHGLKNTQVAKDSGWINMELASKFARSQASRMLGEFTFDLFDSF